jgi:hypothetical protein
LSQRDWYQAVSMSMLSKWTIGAIASKNASASWPVRAAIQLASGVAVSGPVAMMGAMRSPGPAHFGKPDAQDRAGPVARPPRCRPGRRR